jgi:hypothetical protein
MYSFSLGTLMGNTVLAAAATATLVASVILTSVTDRKLDASVTTGERRPFAGALVTPIERSTPSAFHSLVSTLRYTGGTERARACTGTSECDSGAATTSARIEAVDQDPISRTNIPGNGVVVGRVRNTGTQVERRYGLMPNVDNYYLVALPGNGAEYARWQLIEAGSEVHVLATGVIDTCNHGTSSGKPQADFRSCANASAAHAKGMRLNQASFATGDSDPAWMDCDQGCCTFN